MGKLLEALDLAGDVLAGEVTATVETNLLPAVKVYGGEGSSGPGILRALGIRAGVVVRHADGRVLARVGDPAPFQLWRLALLLGAAVAVVVVVRRVAR